MCICVFKALCFKELPYCCLYCCCIEIVVLVSVSRCRILCCNGCFKWRDSQHSADEVSSSYLHGVISFFNNDTNSVNNVIKINLSIFLIVKVIIMNVTKPVLDFFLQHFMILLMIICLLAGMVFANKWLCYGRGTARRTCQ